VTRQLVHDERSLQELILAPSPSHNPSPSPSPNPNPSPDRSLQVVARQAGRLLSCTAPPAEFGGRAVNLHVSLDGETFVLIQTLTQTLTRTRTRSESEPESEH
jgi:hypothetical protein